MWRDCGALGLFSIGPQLAFHLMMITLNCLYSRAHNYLRFFTENWHAIRRDDLFYIYHWYHLPCLIIKVPETGRKRWTGLEGNSQLL